jgi:PTH2 family peptidyl-tRNA hydrolase
MPAGKMAAQAGHAFLESYLASRRIGRPSRALLYSRNSPGTKVVLEANLPKLLRIYEQAKAAGLPCALIEDSGHILPPDFNGEPIITALGIGPATTEEVHAVTGKLSTYRGGAHV